VIDYKRPEINVKMVKTIKKKLYKISCLSWIVKLLPIPVNIVTARLISNICDLSIGGKIYLVIRYSLLLVLLVAVTEMFFSWLEILLRKRISGTVQNIKMKLYDAYMNNELSYLFTSGSGDMKERLIDDFDTVVSEMVLLRPQFWCSVISAICYFLYLLFQSNLIAVTLLLISLIQIIPPFIVKKYLQVSYDETREIEAQITNCVMEAIQGFVVIKMYELKSWWLKRIHALNKAYRRIGNKSIYTSELESAMNEAVSNMLKYGVYGIIGLYVLRKYVTIDVAVQAITLSGSFFGVIKTAGSVISKLAVAKTAERRLAEIESHNSIKSGIVQNGEITVKDIKLVTNGDDALLNCEGQLKMEGLVIIKGENGCGKSTLLRAFVGLHAKWSGELQLGNVSADNLSNANFPEKICYIPQDDFQTSLRPIELFKTAVADSSDKAMKIAEKLGVPAEILNDRRINELSGGERKKVFLALALSINPQIILLDEPTNSLDDRGRQVLFEYIRVRKATTIIVTHNDMFDELPCNKLLLSGGSCYEVV